MSNFGEDEELSYQADERLNRPTFVGGKASVTIVHDDYTVAVRIDGVWRDKSGSRYSDDEACLFERAILSDANLEDAWPGGHLVGNLDALSQERVAHAKECAKRENAYWANRRRGG